MARSATSFLSEHSLSLILAPKIHSLLRKDAAHVLPIYFWATREGASISRSCDPGCPVRMVAIFPRRPKVRAAGQPQIEIKLNQVLFEWSRELDHLDIPTFAVAPMASSLFEVENCSSWIWLSIKPARHSLDVFLDCDIETNTPVRNQSIPQLQITEDQFRSEVRVRTRPHRWSKIVENLRSARSQIAPERFGPFGGPTFYRPVLYLLW